jgi:hypothetical integral membrane protein (TIGR02206 family)
VSVAVLALALVRLVRARPGLEPLVRWSLAGGIVLLVAFELAVGVREGWLGWKALLPLELCDAAMVLAVVTLLWPRWPQAELVYFWAGSGSVLAMLTPELPWTFPRWEFVVFFGLHGLVLAAAVVLVFGLGHRPRPGAPWRAFGITGGWAAFVGLVNLALGTNFMYLRHKPLAATPSTGWGPGPSTSGWVPSWRSPSSTPSLPFRRLWRAAREK